MDTGAKLAADGRVVNGDDILPPDLAKRLSSLASGQSDVASDPDLKLLRRFAATNDADAFAQIVQRYAGVVYGTALRIIGDSGRAEDVSQEAFYRLMRRPNEINQNLGAWLHRTATHLAVDAIRSETCRKKREIVYTRECDREASTWSELSPSVDQALSEMPEELRMLLVRHYLMGRTQAQLAVEMNLSAATISRRMKQGLEELRQRLRLKGVCALPVALAGLLCHVAARQAPAGLVHELGKMAMFSGAVSPSTGSSGLQSSQSIPHAQKAAGQAGKLTVRSAKALGIHAAGLIGPQIFLAIVVMLGTLLFLQFLSGSWSIPFNKPAHQNMPANQENHQRQVMNDAGVHPRGL